MHEYTECRLLPNKKMTWTEIAGIEEIKHKEYEGDSIHLVRRLVSFLTNQSGERNENGENIWNTFKYFEI